MCFWNLQKVFIIFCVMLVLPNDVVNSTVAQEILCLAS